VNKKRSHRFNTEMFNLKKLNEVSSRERSTVLRSQMSLELWKICAAVTGSK
jgi:hypothetical protein